MITAPKEALREALAKARLVSQRTSAAPIFSTTLLQARPENAWLTLTAAGLEAQIALDVECDVSAPLAACVEIERLALALNGPGEETKLAPEGERLKVSTGKSVFRLTTKPAADFPLMAQDGTATASFECAGWLADAIARVLPFCGGEGHPDLYARGVCVRGTADKAFVVEATNKAAAATFTLAHEQKVGAFEFILPKRMAEALASLDPSRAIVKGGMALFLGENMQLTSKLVSAVMPDLSRVYPQGAQRIIAPREALTEAIKSVASVAGVVGKMWRPVRVVSAPDQVLTLSGGGDGDEGRVEVTSDPRSAPLEADYDAGLLLDLLKVGDGDEVEIIFDKPDLLGVVEERMRAVMVRFRG